MKSLACYIQEKLVIKKSTSFNPKYFPQTKEELREIIEQRIKIEGSEVDLNDIDVSRIIDMSDLFRGLDFNGDISNWDVYNVTDMENMFWECKNFNQDISTWNVSNVTNMDSMFWRCKSFNQDISDWDVSKVKDMYGMFFGCESFNQDISLWDVSKVLNMSHMFYDCKSFNQDISTWDVSNVKNKSGIFLKCPIQEKYKPKFF